MLYAEVIIDINHESVDNIFNYGIPDDIVNDIYIGMRVFVPFGKGNTVREGYVVGFSNSLPEDLPKDMKIKNIKELPDDYQIFNENMIMLAKFISKKYYCLLSEALQCIMPTIVNFVKQNYVSLNLDNPDLDDIINKILNSKSNNKAQLKVINYLKENKEPIYTKTLETKAGVSNSTINTLKKKEVIKFTAKETKKYNVLPKNLTKSEFLILNQEQQRAYDFIISKIRTNDALSNKPIVLHGVTGSGKTEIYLYIIRDILEQGKQAIVLVPEISLTPQTLERFTSRFGEKVSITHSKLNNLERLEQWKKAKDGEISIMIGARSAIFTPFENLGVIIIDEEHERTYKSESVPKYDTRELAIKLSELTGALVIFGSATPSIETYYKATEKEYDLVSIYNKTNNTPTEVSIVDMRKELKNGNPSIFSVDLFNEIDYNLKNNLQTILFLNRRGHSTYISCRECGHVLECDNCDINYTYHKNFNKLSCHYCDAVRQVPNVCPSCNSKHIKYIGIGTQKIEESVRKYFEDARILRMDLDTTTTKNSHEKILNAFKNQEADILIGTQMISKGLDFPNVALVGVIMADTALHTGDFKSSENCFQILNQVCGRAGRSDILGKAIIQTYLPEDDSIVLAKENNYKGFYDVEIQRRKKRWYPPFCNIFFILLTSLDEQYVFKRIIYLHSILKHYNQKTKYELFDVSKANIYKIKNKYRYKIIIKAPNESPADEERLKNFVMYCIQIFKRERDTSNLIISLSLNPNNMQ